MKQLSSKELSATIVAPISRLLMDVERTLGLKPEEADGMVEQESGEEPTPAKTGAPFVTAEAAGMGGVNSLSAQEAPTVPPGAVRGKETPQAEAAPEAGRVGEPVLERAAGPGTSPEPAVTGAISEAAPQVEGNGATGRRAVRLLRSGPDRINTADSAIQQAPEPRAPAKESLPTDGGSAEARGPVLNRAGAEASLPEAIAGAVTKSPEAGPLGTDTKGSAGEAAENFRQAESNGKTMPGAGAIPLRKKEPRGASVDMDGQQGRTEALPETPGGGREVMRAASPADSGLPEPDRGRPVRPLAPRRAASPPRPDGARESLPAPLIGQPGTPETPGGEREVVRAASPADGGPPEPDRDRPVRPLPLKRAAPPHRPEGPRESPPGPLIGPPGIMAGGPPETGVKSSAERTIPPESSRSGRQAEREAERQASKPAARRRGIPLGRKQAGPLPTGSSLYWSTGGHRAPQPDYPASSTLFQPGVNGGAGGGWATRGAAGGTPAGRAPAARGLEGSPMRPGEAGAEAGTGAGPAPGGIDRERLEELLVDILRDSARLQGLDI